MEKSITLEKKIAKADADARKKAEEAGLDETATQEAVNEAISKAKASFEKKEKSFSWLIKVKNNPDFCGIGAGGVQFANGKAVITSKRMADWFTEHEGYEVISQ